MGLSRTSNRTIPACATARQPLGSAKGGWRLLINTHSNQRPPMRLSLVGFLMAVMIAPIPFAAPNPPLSPSEVSLSHLKARVRLATGQKTLRIRAHGPVSFEWGTKKETLAAATYSIQTSGAARGRQRYHLFAKTFLPNEARQADAYCAEWKAKGYHPEIVVFGKSMRAEGGKVIDNRSLWISLQRFDNEADAEALRKSLEKQEIWGWIRPETVHRNTAKVLIRAEGKTAALEAVTPLRITSTAPLDVGDVNTGFWKAARKTTAFSGSIDIRAGLDGLLELIENVPIEVYLAGVLPAEMPAEWPKEALKAQAVAARSEVLANLAGKHSLDDFDFCCTEHCRAYGGNSGREDATDAAIRETKGIVLTSAGRIAPTYFSANCGGWTENNENIWSGPPNPILRGKPDLPPKKKPRLFQLDSASLSEWLKSRPSAFCSANSANFRWTKRFSEQEISALFNKQYSVGQVREIKPEARGVSGRLKSLRIIGTKGSITITKELNIRLAFGGLPSAMFIIERGKTGKETAAFTFYGGGRGHGVGLCQDGARGMASAGYGFVDILRHYFSSAEVKRVD